MRFILSNARLHSRLTAVSISCTINRLFHIPRFSRILHRSSSRTSLPFSRRRRPERGCSKLRERTCLIRSFRRVATLSEFRNAEGDSHPFPFVYEDVHDAQRCRRDIHFPVFSFSGFVPQLRKHEKSHSVKRMNFVGMQV